MSETTIGTQTLREGLRELVSNIPTDYHWIEAMERGALETYEYDCDIQSAILQVVDEWQTTRGTYIDPMDDWFGACVVVDADGRQYLLHMQEVPITMGRTFVERNEGCEYTDARLMEVFAWRVEGSFLELEVSIPYQYLMMGEQQAFKQATLAPGS